MFRKRKNKPEATSESARFTEKAAAKIVAAILYLQNGFAAFMNRKTKNLSAKTWKLIIVFFAVIWGGFSIYFISTAFSKRSSVKINSSRIMMVKPKRPDSLQLMEEIYKQQKNKINK